MNSTNRIPSASLTLIAACSLLIGAANAHPEMDEQGRDITSGPVNTFSMDDVPADGPITNSVGLAIVCSRQTPEACPPKARQAKPVRVRPDF